MLKLFRKNTKIIIWIVVLSFVIWGGYSVSSQFDKKDRYAGEVFGESVTFQEFDRFYRSVQMFAFGDNKTPEAPEVIREQAWQSLMFSREGKRQKIAVTDQEVRNEIFRLLALQKIENPTPEIYQSWVKSSLRTTPQVFESQIRELLRIQKLIQKINDEPTSAPSEEDLKKIFEIEEQKISLEILLFKTLEEAKNFAAKAVNGKSWKKEADSAKLTPMFTTMVNLETLTRMWGIPEDQAVKLWEYEQGKITPPGEMNGQFALFYILGKEKADDKKFNDETKEKYRTKFTQKQKYERFILWNQKLFLEASLKDYQSLK